ncbi:MAG: recombinase family protein [bacterium]|nr:recombinase family protein [bacterium]
MYAPVRTETVRCAVYTRKSTDEGLDQAFNSLDAQREAGEAFITSRKHEGWVCLPERYDDGGFSGGNVERPALKRLMADIEAGRIDAVVCYKVDRLSRSLLDFSRLIEVFDRHRVMFISVTQPINTADSGGRLMLNVLLSFAQFEREMIADRTRDKVSAARRRGKWTGGFQVLGYDVHPDGGRLVVNEDEAEIVRQVFALYLECGSIQATTEELNRRGWRTKSWTTKKGAFHPGAPFTKNTVNHMLANPLYVGRTRLHKESFEGEHPAIVDHDLFDRVQAQLAANNVSGGAVAKNRYGHLLRGLLHCAACGCAMTPSVSKKTGRVYRYYVCGNATKTGWDNCPCPSLPAKAIEAAVVDRIKAIGRDPELVAATLDRVKALQRERQPQLVAERRHLDRELTRLRDGGRTEDQDQVGRLELRQGEVDDELAFLRATSIDRRDLSRALAAFDEVWACLLPREQERVIGLLVDRIEFDGARETVAITFKPTGIKSLAADVALAQEAV